MLPWKKANRSSKSREAGSRLATRRVAVNRFQWTNPGSRMPTIPLSGCALCKKQNRARQEIQCTRSHKIVRAQMHGELFHLPTILLPTLEQILHPSTVNYPVVNNLNHLTHWTQFLGGLLLKLLLLLLLLLSMLTLSYCFLVICSKTARLGLTRLVSNAVLSIM